MAGYRGGNKYKGVAPALNTLLDQLNRKAPKRSKASDGALGNAAHAASVSFHNPNPAGIVQARDYTHDPANGLDTKWLAKALVQSGDPRILEIISNRKYWTPEGGWVTYYGSNPHDKHLHLSVRSEPALYNSTAPWNLGDDTTPLPSEEDVMTPDQFKYLQIMNGKLDRATDAAEGVWRMLKGTHGDDADRLTDLWTAILSIQDPQQTSDPEAVAAALARLLPADIAEQVAQKLADRLAA